MNDRIRAKKRWRVWRNINYHRPANRWAGQWSGRNRSHSRTSAWRTAWGIIIGRLTGFTQQVGWEKLRDFRIYWNWPDIFRLVCVNSTWLSGAFSLFSTASAVSTCLSAGVCLCSTLETGDRWRRQSSPSRADQRPDGRASEQASE